MHINVADKYVWCLQKTQAKITLNQAWPFEASDHARTSHFATPLNSLVAKRYVRKIIQTCKQRHVQRSQ
jgi:cytochrome b